MSASDRTPTYSVLVPTLNRPDRLLRMLDSVAKQTVQPIEVVIIDQSDTDSTKIAFEGWNPPGIKKKYIHRKVKGLIPARNAGLDACANDADVISFFDDDLILMPDFSEHILRVFEADTQGVYGGAMGTIQGYSYKWRPLEKFFLMPHEGTGKFLPSGAPTYPHWKKEFTETEFVAGGITFWRRAVAQAYRYDERLIGYGQGDDVDFSYRVTRKYKAFMQPKSLCLHEDHAPGHDTAWVHQRQWIQNMYYLSQKNGLSLWAWAWFAFGHAYRDLIHLKPRRLRGALQGIWNALRGKIDSVNGYEDFLRQRQLVGKATRT